MGWEDLLESGGDRRVIPWLGGRRVYRDGRIWRLKRLPVEHGWYTFNLAGRKANKEIKAEQDPEYGKGWQRVEGYLVGNRLIPDNTTVSVNPDELGTSSLQVYLVEEGLDRFTRISAVCDPDERLIYMDEVFPLGPEDEVRRAYVDRAESVDHIRDVTPALDLAFRFMSHQRELVEERQAELERQHQEALRQEEVARKRDEAMRKMGTGEGRRELAQVDFTAAATAALGISGAEFLDTRDISKRVAAVQYRIEGRRLECTVNKDTLQIIDAGVCLGHGRDKGDKKFTLESLPGVVRWIIQDPRYHLVVYRHAPGDRDYEEDYW
jgi:hypothetical protein